MESNVASKDKYINDLKDKVRDLEDIIRGKEAVGQKDSTLQTTLNGGRDQSKERTAKVQSKYTG